MFLKKIYSFKKTNPNNSGIFFDILSILFLICIFYIIGIYSYWKANQGLGDTDTAFFLDVINNTLSNGLPTTRIVHAFLDALPFFDMPLDKFCATDFSSISNTTQSNILIGHSNLIVYPLSAISYFIGPELTAAFANIISFALLPLISYIYLRKTKTPPALCFLFMLVVCTHPAWRIALAGGFYFDRLFMPIALCYALALYNPISQRQTMALWQMVVIASLAFVGAFIHERGALLLLIFSLCSVALYRRQPKINRNFIWGVIFFLITYILIYMQFQKNIDQHEVFKSFLSFDKFIGNVFRPGLIKLIFFNFLLLLIALIFERRVAIISIITILPNIFVSVGGAEKDGWVTHYHSFYFAFFIYAGIIGVIKASDWYRNKDETSHKKSHYSFYLSTFLMFVGFLMCFQNPYGKTIAWNSKYAIEGIITPIYDLYARPKALSSFRYEAARSDKLVSLIPIGASVSVTEPFEFWKLVKNKNDISLFPVGLGRSEYLLLAYQSDPSGIPIFDILRYAPHKEQARQCVADAIQAAGYKEVARFDHLMILRKHM